VGDELPSTIGPYRVLRRLGEGGVAEVFLAVAYGAAGFEKRVALKRLRPELQGDGRLEKLLVDEARIAARLQHGRLVGVHELALDPTTGSYYVRLDAVDGPSLAELVRRRGPLAPALALFVAEELALALAVVHDARDDAGRPLGLVHRDLSPSNVLVSTNGEVKLADFGLAKATHLQTTTRANVVKGTYAYMSPEQVAGAPLGPASDQFALASTVHELLTGRRAFDGDTVHATMDSVRSAPPAPLPAELPSEISALLARCHEKSPAARFPSTEALVEAIAAVRRALPLAGSLDLARVVRAA
jgi:serine/threonine-protein kinase